MPVESRVAGDPLAYSVDRSWGNVKHDADGNMFPSDARKMHRRRDGDCLAACSSRIILNWPNELGVSAAQVGSWARCRRCWPDK